MTDHTWYFLHKNIWMAKIWQIHGHSFSGTNVFFGTVIIIVSVDKVGKVESVYCQRIFETAQEQAVIFTMKI